MLSNVNKNIRKVYILQTIIDYKNILLYCNLVDKDLIDYNSIVERCGIGILPTSTVVKNLENLDEFYDSTDLVDIYNYLLNTLEDPEILLHVIKLSDAYRNATTLSILVDMLKFNLSCDNEEKFESFVNVRALCAKAISNYKDNSTVTLLLSCMNNKNEHYKVRLACADALGRIGDKYAVVSLIDVIEDEEEKSVYLKESATFALGLLGDMRAIDPLINILESKQGFLDKFSFLKEKIVESLGKLNLNNKKVIKALKNSLMDSSPLVRINAIEAIMNSEDEDAVEIIRPCLKDDDEEVQRNALIALYNLCGKDILDEVIELPSYSEFLRNEAKELLNEYESDVEDYDG